MKLFKSMMTLLAVLFASHAFADYFSANNVSVELVNNRGYELPTFLASHPVRGSRSESVIKTYVEAQPEQRYAIRIRNHSSERIAVVVAVDGRNIISGEHSKLKSNERKYVLGPYQTATYRGWRSSKNRINEFYFTHEDNSYSAAFGDYSAMGVIAAAVFRDKDRYRYEEFHDEDRGYGKRLNKQGAANSAPSAKSDSRAMESSSQPGTGYGDERHSRSRQVAFNEERRASAKFLIKYEWRETLCERGITRCYAQSNRPNRNRLWNEGYNVDARSPRLRYAPPPPRYRNFIR